MPGPPCWYDNPPSCCLSSDVATDTAIAPTLPTPPVPPVAEVLSASDSLAARPSLTEPPAPARSKGADDSARTVEQPADMPLQQWPIVQDTIRRGRWADLLLNASVQESLQHHCPLCYQWLATPTSIKYHLTVQHPEWTACQPNALKLLQSFRRHTVVPCRYCHLSNVNRDRHWRQCHVLHICAFLAVHDGGSRERAGCTGEAVLVPCRAAEARARDDQLCLRMSRTRPSGNDSTHRTRARAKARTKGERATRAAKASTKVNTDRAYQAWQTWDRWEAGSRVTQVVSEDRRTTPGTRHRTFRPPSTSTPSG